MKNDVQIVEDHDRILDLLRNNPDQAEHITKMITKLSQAGVEPIGIACVVNGDTDLPIRIDENFLFKYFSHELESGQHFLSAYVRMKIFEFIERGSEKVLIEVTKQLGIFDKPEEKEEDQRPILEVASVVHNHEQWESAAEDDESTEDKIQRVLSSAKKKK